MRGFYLALVLALLVGCQKTAPKAPPKTPQPAKVTAVSPPLVTNDLTYPISIYGTNLPKNATVEVVYKSKTLALKTQWIRDGQLIATLPANAVSVAPETVWVDATIQVRVATSAIGQSPLRIVNDLGYGLPSDLAVSYDGQRAFVAVPTLDQVWALGASDKAQAIPVGDRPIALGRWTNAEEDFLIVAHAYDDIWVISMKDPTQIRKFTAPAEVQGIDVWQNTLFVTERLTDAVHRFDLTTGKPLTALKAGANPRKVAADSNTGAWVGNLGSSDLSRLDYAASTSVRISPGPNAKILGGNTAKNAPFIMGGSGIRDLAVAPDLGVLFMADLGPNIGPNPDRDDVSQNGGVGVVELATGAYRHHYSMFTGAPEQIAYDAKHQRLFVTDISRGRLVVFDAKRLADGAPKAMIAVAKLGDVQEGDFAGPVAVRLVSDQVFVLNRLRSTIVVFDNAAALPKHMNPAQVWKGLPTTQQTIRLHGEALFKSDVGNSRMSCDTCHYDGHNQGVLFTKRKLIHIYRAPTLRAISLSPPYFTPARFPTLEVVSRLVSNENRFHKPEVTPAEIGALTQFQKTLVTPPNPYIASGYPKTIALPDGAQGDPAAGGLTFESRCASCHTPGAFTTDQDPKTRGKLHDVGTSVTQPLRLGMQNAPSYPLPPPALLGVWDNFPLLHSGEAGFSIVDDERLVATETFPLREVLNLAVASGEHGDLKEQSAQDIDDLLAYLMTL